MILDTCENCGSKDLIEGKYYVTCNKCGYLHQMIKATVKK